MYNNICPACVNRNLQKGESCSTCGRRPSLFVQKLTEQRDIDYEDYTKDPSNWPENIR